MALVQSEYFKSLNSAEFVKNVHFRYIALVEKIHTEIKAREGKCKAIIQLIFATGNIWNTLNKIKRAIKEERRNLLSLTEDGRHQGWVETPWIGCFYQWSLLTADAAPKIALRMALWQRRKRCNAEEISWEFFMTFKWIHKLIKKMYMKTLCCAWSISSRFFLIIYWAYLFNVIFCSALQLFFFFFFIGHKQKNMNFKSKIYHKNFTF